MTETREMILNADTMDAYITLFGLNDQNIAMIEQDLQNRVKAALEALGIDGLVVCGNYIAANAGAVMGEETPDCKMLAEIVTAPRRADDYGWLCPISVQMGLSLGFKFDADLLESKK